MVDRASISRSAVGPARRPSISDLGIRAGVSASLPGWRSRDSFNAGLPYANHAHPYLLTMYGWIAAVRMATGVPLFVATNSTPFFDMVVVLGAVALLLARTGILGRARSLRVPAAVPLIGPPSLPWRFWVICIDTTTTTRIRCSPSREWSPD